ncbi:Gfo/Idh/MocA family protein [Paenibacillus sp. JCM 10914]|uniref:Gfo/Idh/MocA family protein n=1 Tax=Paenibacillus sp. JCM 10914 TaxID=1236974 RepID=UPI0003CC4B1E|nr:Gfo/Idh/MocA family oxidoreductase [Paenibacillus sp. JCM 10914]GAE06915.1 probable oxidoreductase [Paenibacillus sp. JCM 10914]
MLDRIPIPKVDGPVRFGVIGLGMISEFHLKAINRIEQAILLGVASRREEQTKNIAAEHGCYAATDYRELLRIKELDVVCVTTSSGSHYEIGMEVLRSGKHLVVEKPLAMTAEQANELIATAAERRLMLSVISQRRFEPQHGIIKDVLSQGKLGRLLMAEVSCPYYRSQDYYDSADWRGRMDQDGGA